MIKFFDTSMVARRCQSKKINKNNKKINKKKKIEKVRKILFRKKTTKLPRPISTKSDKKNFYLKKENNNTKLP